MALPAPVRATGAKEHGPVTAPCAKKSTENELRFGLDKANRLEPSLKRLHALYQDNRMKIPSTGRWFLKGHDLKACPELAEGCRKSGRRIVGFGP
jgi:hypothetical protein